MKTIQLCARVIAATCCLVVAAAVAPAQDIGILTYLQHIRTSGDSNLHHPLRCQPARHRHLVERKLPGPAL